MSILKINKRSLWVNTDLFDADPKGEFGDLRLLTESLTIGPSLDGNYLIIEIMYLCLQVSQTVDGRPDGLS